MLTFVLQTPGAAYGAWSVLDALLVPALRSGHWHLCHRSSECAWRFGLSGLKRNPRSAAPCKKNRRLTPSSFRFSTQKQKIIASWDHCHAYGAELPGLAIRLSAAFSQKWPGQTLPRQPISFRGGGRSQLLLIFSQYHRIGPSTVNIRIKQCRVPRPDYLIALAPKNPTFLRKARV